MLIDLARNDVGRVAQFGSVELSDVMVVERYSHVMHITSNVRGRLKPGTTALDALRAGLPAGTVSGAPKVRAMEIIDEIEKQRRGPYAGAVGYIDFAGNMDTCIALRTLVMLGNTAYIQVGAGIVADSVPADGIRRDAEQGEWPAQGDRTRRARPGRQLSPARRGRQTFAPKKKHKGIAYGRAAESAAHRRQCPCDDPYSKAKRLRRFLGVRRSGLWRSRGAIFLGVGSIRHCRNRRGHSSCTA